VSKKQLSQATLQKSNTEEELHAAEEELTTTKKVLADDESYLAELKESCSAKATAWSIRQKDAGEETAAIEKAKEILSTGVKVFLQTSSMTRVGTKDEDVEQAQRRASAVRTLRSLAKKYNTFGLLELSMSAQSDPFGKVRGLIESMIAKLTKEAAEEADLKSFCDEETAESKKKQADLSAKLDKTNARIAKAVASKAKLTEDIKVLEEQIAEIDAADAEATKIRGEEHEEYLKSSKDLKDSAEAVAKAISVLTEYYSSLRSSRRERSRLSRATRETSLRRSRRCWRLRSRTCPSCWRRRKQGRARRRPRSRSSSRRTRFRRPRRWLTRRERRRK
jgi:chromosome segregation ATPase